MNSCLSINDALTDLFSRYGVAVELRTHLELELERAKDDLERLIEERDELLARIVEARPEERGGSAAITRIGAGPAS
ncbi:hypothetical protein [Ancylobacter polymorphus]|uniref:DUF904 domain-containing protein n=1 Tax=Ancylobacter polymorphus TaxID=223390 RepID=A0ABU0B7B1_9HYPH|nr:hypothetical protein [Ancylobacter polymorphus]MDQ0301270.1 hypothetical protein [Ancylobacter polymorphus]